jgi:hypothetical protein
MSLPLAPNSGLQRMSGRGVSDVNDLSVRVI